MIGQNVIKLDIDELTKPDNPEHVATTEKSIENKDKSEISKQEYSSLNTPDIKLEEETKTNNNDSQSNKNINDSLQKGKKNKISSQRKSKSRLSRLFIDPQEDTTTQHPKKIYTEEEKIQKALDNSIYFNSYIITNRNDLNRHFLKRKIEQNYEREDKSQIFFNVPFYPKEDMFPGNLLTKNNAYLYNMSRNNQYMPNKPGMIPNRNMNYQNGSRYMNNGPKSTINLGTNPIKTNTNVTNNSMIKNNITNNNNINNANKVMKEVVNNNINNNSNVNACITTIDLSKNKGSNQTDGGNKNINIGNKPNLNNANINNIPGNEQKNNNPNNNNNNNNNKSNENININNNSSNTKSNINLVKNPKHILDTSLLNDKDNFIIGGNKNEGNNSTKKNVLLFALKTNHTTNPNSNNSKNVQINEKDKEKEKDFPNNERSKIIFKNISSESKEGDKIKKEIEKKKEENKENKENK